MPLQSTPTAMPRSCGAAESCSSNGSSIDKRHGSLRLPRTLRPCLFRFSHADCQCLGIVAEVAALQWKRRAIEMHAVRMSNEYAYYLHRPFHSRMQSGLKDSEPEHDARSDGWETVLTSRAYAV